MRDDGNNARGQERNVVGQATHSGGRHHGPIKLRERSGLDGAGHVMQRCGNRVATVIPRWKYWPGEDTQLDGGMK